MRRTRLSEARQTAYDWYDIGYRKAQGRAVAQATDIEERLARLTSGMTARQALDFAMLVRQLND